MTNDMKRQRCLIEVVFFLAFLVCLGVREAQAEVVDQDLTHLGLEELMNLEVYSPSKQAQALADSTSAAFVITQEDIRRSGVTNIPDALRLAPGVNVARIDANKWAISIRGFNGRFANKLLVMVDGRSIYTPAFAGVYWENQDLLLEDIERIEVIRGPGASLWGANAVNGVVNILTKKASDTRGLISLTAGDPQDNILGVRYSGTLGDRVNYRLYGKYLDQAGLLDEQGRDAKDDWHLGSGGFRLDWTPTEQDSATLQGGLSDGRLQQNLQVPTLVAPYSELRRDSGSLSSAYLHGRWERVLTTGSRLSLLMSYQNQHRRDGILGFDIDTLDLEFQHSLALNDRHALVWGLGQRRYSDEYRPTTLGTMQPLKLDYDLFSVFLQDQISLRPQELELTLGARLEHNEFSGWEWQPNIRLLWTPHPQHRLWAAVSRAKRTPSRGDQGIGLDLMTVPPQTPQNPLPLPILSVFQGNRAFDSEQLTAYELGYRTWPSPQLSFDVAAFYNEYDDMRAVEPRSDLGTLEYGYLRVPNLFVNAVRGRTYGCEIAANWQAADWWRLQWTYSFLQVELFDKAGFATLIPVVRNGSQPQYQTALRSSFDIRPGLEFDLWLYRIDDLPDLAVGTPAGTTAVDGYYSLNARLGWHPSREVEFSLIGTNLVGPAHIEYVQETYPFPEKVSRRIYGQVKWSF